MKRNNIFFTSDHHFGHANIIKFCKRPFTSANEMDEVMIERWNAKVAPNDEVYHLGDLSLADAKRTREVLNQLNGKIYLIKGNHEGSALTYRKRFEWIKDYYELKVKDGDLRNGVQTIILFHYALRTWRSAKRGNWQLYGHSHGNLREDEFMLSFDIGVDSHNFYPLSYEEVKTKMLEKQEHIVARRKAEAIAQT